jgi:segregation and condensation protein B
MKAAGLLDLNMPSGFAVPDPTRPAEDEDPLELGEAAEFHQDFLGGDE